jgi:hypothetical protein
MRRFDKINIITEANQRLENEFLKSKVLIKEEHVSKEDHGNIEKLLDDLKKEMKDLGTDKDLINTYQHKISNRLCK